MGQQLVYKLLALNLKKFWANQRNQSVCQQMDDFETFIENKNLFEKEYKLQNNKINKDIKILNDKLDTLNKRKRKNYENFNINQLIVKKLHDIQIKQFMVSDLLDILKNYADSFYEFVIKNQYTNADYYLSSIVKNGTCVEFKYLFEQETETYDDKEIVFDKELCLKYLESLTKYDDKYCSCIPDDEGKFTCFIGIDPIDETSKKYFYNTVSGFVVKKPFVFQLNIR